MATEDKLNMSLDAMIAKSSKKHVSKKAGGRKIVVGGKGPGAKAPGSGGKKLGNSVKSRTLGVGGGKGSVQKRTSAPRRISGPNPNNFLNRDVESDMPEPSMYNDPARPRIQMDSLQRVQQGLLTPDSPGKWQHDMFDGPVARRSAATARSRIETGFKLQINNLDHKVSNEDIQELFKEFGAVKRAGVAVDRNGRSQGHAEVVYANRAHAVAAQKKYNKVCLDGKPMHIELVSSPAVNRTVDALSSGIRISRGGGNDNAGGGRAVTVGRAGSGGMRSAQGPARGRRAGNGLAGRGRAAMDED